MDLEVSLGLIGQNNKASGDKECFLFPFARFSIGHYFCDWAFTDASDMLDLGGPTGGRLNPLLEY